jgi:hypothetical protein
MDTFGEDYMARLIEGVKIKRYIKNASGQQREVEDPVMEGLRVPKTQEQINLEEE